MDPRVLVVRARPPDECSRAAIHLADFTAHVALAADRELVRIDVGGTTLRLDVVEGTLTAGPVGIEPSVTLGAPLDQQLHAIRQLDALLAGQPLISDCNRRLGGLVSALRAVDAIEAGASLRDIGLDLLGGSDWPGDGEHLKSRARRLVMLARALVSAGPAGVLAFRI